MEYNYICVAPTEDELLRLQRRALELVAKAYALYLKSALYDRSIAARSYWTDLQQFRIIETIISGVPETVVLYKFHVKIISNTQNVFPVWNEVRAEAIDIADRQNTHIMTIHGIHLSKGLATTKQIGTL